MDNLSIIIVFSIGIFGFYQVCLKNKDYLTYLSNKDYNSLSNYSLIMERGRKDNNTYSKHQKLKNLLKVKYVLKDKLENIEADLLIISQEIKSKDYLDYSLIDNEYNNLIKKEGDLIANNAN